MFDGARAAQKLWSKTPLWRRAEMLKKAAALMRENAVPMADCLIKEVAKPKKVHRRPNGSLTSARLVIR